MRHRGLAAVLVACGLVAGCGTSKWSDTKRTATEQLLISDAMDRAVSRLDFSAMAGKKAYLDNRAVKEVVDHEYLSSSVRQHMLASGCILRDEQKEADYVVELRAGAVGTDRHDVLYGVPAVNVPALVPLSGVPSTIPEIPLAKKTDQRAVVKIAVFAYNRATGRPVWQSGVVPVESQAKDIWFFGAGPFQRGTIYEGTSFAGARLDMPLVDLQREDAEGAEPVSVADEARFIEPEEEIAQSEAPRDSEERPNKVVKAVAIEGADSKGDVPARAEVSSSKPRRFPAWPRGALTPELEPPPARGWFEETLRIALPGRRRRNVEEEFASPFEPIEEEPSSEAPAVAP